MTREGGQDYVPPAERIAHTGVSQEEFDRIAAASFAEAKHPKIGRLFRECTYVPQVELLEYLREHEFRTFIVSGGGIDFRLSPLTEALDKAEQFGITVVSMKRDWNTVFGGDAA